MRMPGLLFLAVVALACQATGVQGLDPREPVQIDVDVWPDILTLRPTFRWAPFPGQEDERIYGEEIACFVVVKPGEALSAEEIRRHCAGALADFKIPSVIEFRSDLPKSPAGKVRRALLIDGG